MQVDKESVPQYTLLLDQEDMVILRRIVQEAIHRDNLSGPESSWAQHFVRVTSELMR